MYHPFLLWVHYGTKKELVSVSFDYSVERIDYRLAVTVEKTGDTFSGSFQERPMQKPETFTLTGDDFDELTKIVAQMGKPAKKSDQPVTNESREGTFTVVLNSEGKDITCEYEIGKFSAERETNLKNEAIDLIKRWIDRRKEKSEIRIGWTRALPLSTYAFLFMPSRPIWWNTWVSLLSRGTKEMICAVVANRERIAGKR